MNAEPPHEDPDLEPFVGLSPKWSSVLTGLIGVIFIAVAFAAPGARHPSFDLTVFRIASVLLGVGLLALIWFDLREFRLPDLINFALMIAGGFLIIRTNPDLIVWRMLAGAVGYALIWCLHIVSQRIRGYPGIGLGDAKLMAVGGIWLGVWQLPFLLLGASVIGLVFSLIVSALKNDQESSESVAIPFGPAIAVTIWLLWLIPIFELF